MENLRFLNQQEHLLLEQLMNPDHGIEAIMRLGRVPTFMRAQGKNTRWVICIIPPQGTQFGDKIIHGLGVGGVGDQAAVIFASPEGQVRGMAETLYLTETQAAPLEQRINAELEKLIAGGLNIPIYNRP